MYPVINPSGGIPVIVSPTLPVEVTVPACDIVFKCEVRIATGEYTHAVKIKHKLYVSQQMFDKLKVEMKI